MTFDTEDGGATTATENTVGDTFEKDRNLVVNRDQDTESEDDPEEPFDPPTPQPKYGAGHVKDQRPKPKAQPRQHQHLRIEEDSEDEKETVAWMHEGHHSSDEDSDMGDWSRERGLPSPSAPARVLRAEACPMTTFTFGKYRGRTFQNVTE